MLLFRIHQNQVAICVVLTIYSFNLLLLLVPVYAETKIDVGVFPVLANASFAVMEQQGWAREEGLKFNFLELNQPGTVIQGMVSDEFDLATPAPGALMAALSKGARFKIIAAITLESTKVIGIGELAKLAMVASTEEAIKKFQDIFDRNPRIALPPKGAGSSALFENWLRVRELLDDVDLLPMMIPAIQQSLMAGHIDGGIIFEPTLAILQSRNIPVKILIAGKDLFPGEASFAVAASDRFTRKNPEAVKKFLRLHRRATQLIHDNPEQAAKDYDAIFSRGLIPMSRLTQAIKNDSETFTTDPKEIENFVSAVPQFMIDAQVFTIAPNIDNIFDFSFYNATIPESSTTAP